MINMRYAKIFCRPHWHIVVAEAGVKKCPAKPKITKETLNVHSEKRKPREDRQNHRYRKYHRYHVSHR